MLYLALVLAGLLFATPLVWMLSASLKPEAEIASGDAGLLPRLRDAGHPEGLARTSAAYWSRAAAQARENYAGALGGDGRDFARYLRNSILLAVLGVPGMVLASAVSAFGFARLEWRGREAVFFLLMASMMLPFTVVMAPQYLLFKSLGWIGTFAPLWVPAWCGSAFSVFLLRQFYRGIPRELDEAAMIDGCSTFGVFRRVILPLSRPALVVVAILHGVWVWGDFVAPLVFINHEEMYTAALGLQMFQTQHGATAWSQLMAASVVVVVPVLVLFVVAKRWIVEGVASQGLKTG